MIPLYLFTGFLDSGKTKFIQETLEDPRFSTDEKTLLVLCEEGEVEYEPKKFASQNVTIVTIDSKEAFTREYLRNLAAKHHSDRVLMEYNGMWQLSLLYENMPKNWQMYQHISLAAAPSFALYNANMRSLVIERFSGAEMVLFNRCNADTDKMELHKIVRSSNRRSEIAYEYENGSVDYDEIEDPLPFDLEADVVEIADNDFGLWYMDITEDPQKYAGKQVRFLAQVCQTPRVPKGAFAPGRFVMTCCVEDITFVGLVCKYEKVESLKDRDWVTITAKIKIEYAAIYGGKGPVLVASDVQPAQKPGEEVVYFS
ncbi:MAG: outer membrane insertion C- signal [Pygmaiobacter sp.]|jgi:uncharacterized membrane protein YcgQ (UPF0703/DUF1980 family)|nr:outer membrane insertion C- signal [Pygmaiobacter sp.]